MCEDAESELLYLQRVIDKCGALYKRGVSTAALKILLKEYYGEVIIASIIKVVEKEGGAVDSTSQLMKELGQEPA